MQLVERIDLLAVDGDDAVAGLDAGLLRGRAVDRGLDPEVVRLGEEVAAGRTEDGEHQEDGDDGLEEVHRRAGGGDGEPLGVALLAVGAGLVLGRHLVEVVHADDAHVGARGDGLDAVLGLAPLERPQLRAEARGRTR